MAKFIVKGKVKYNGKVYASGQVVEVEQKDVAQFEKHGWKIVVEEQPVEEQPVDYSKLTNAQLEQVLTEKGIEFTKGSKKAELLALLA